MSENNMPAIEAENMELDEKVVQSYELAFHVLPTIAEGEVSSVFDKLKAFIKKEGGEIFGEESPERFELAYEVVKHLEGKNRRFKSAYFGWVRFKAVPESAVSINNEVAQNPTLLRHLLIKLTRTEEENPFNFHESIREQKMVTTVEDLEVIPEDAESEDLAKEDGEVDQEALDKALEEKEV